MTGFLILAATVVLGGCVVPFTDRGQSPPDALISNPFFRFGVLAVAIIIGLSMIAFAIHYIPKRIFLGESIEVRYMFYNRIFERTELTSATLGDRHLSGDFGLVQVNETILKMKFIDGTRIKVSLIKDRDRAFLKELEAIVETKLLDQKNQPRGVARLTELDLFSLVDSTQQN